MGKNVRKECEDLSVENEGHSPGNPVLLLSPGGDICICFEEGKIKHAHTKEKAFPQNRNKRDMHE